MIEALIDGERRGGVLADLAKGRMRPPGSWPTCRWRWPAGSPGTTRCCAACTWTGSGCSTRPSPAWTSGSRPGRALAAGGGPAQVRAGVRRRGDLAWLAEIGPAPHKWFARHEKLASWVSLCPGNNISARKRKHGRTGDAGTYIKPMLVQAAWAAIRVRGRLQARYNRLVRRFGGQRTRPRRRRRSPRSRTPCSRSPTRSSRAGPPTRTWAPTSTPGGTPEEQQA